MQNNPALSMLGLSRRAGKLSVGTQAVLTAVKKHRACLVVIASDISPKTEKEIRFAAKETDLEIIRIKEDIFAVSKAIGIKAGVLSVDDKGLAEAVRKRCADTGEEMSL